MDANTMQDLAKRYQEHKDFITNEEAAKMALVVPFIRLLGYEPNNPREVRLEYAAEFTQGDGKRLPDRMDFVIFDTTGLKPLIAIEAKPLGYDLMSKSQQLARYVAQMKDLHFGILTDGCRYMFFGDIENPNIMDKEPFFQFSLDDSKADWGRIAKFLEKFSRDKFNDETLVTDAENSRYRQAMIDKLAAVLRSPGENEGFIKWLSDNIYKGMRTTKVMARMAELAKEAIEPALIRVISDDFLAKLRERIQLEQKKDQTSSQIVSNSSPMVTNAEEPLSEFTEDASRKIETTEEELSFYQQVKDICVANGELPESIICNDTINYFNVSYMKVRSWFVRFVTRGSKRRQIITLISIEELKTLMPPETQMDTPSISFGQSRFYIDAGTDIRSFSHIFLRSLNILKKGSGAINKLPISE